MKIKLVSCVVISSLAVTAAAQAQYQPVTSRQIAQGYALTSFGDFGDALKVEIFNTTERSITLKVSGNVELSQAQHFDGPYTVVSSTSSYQMDDGNSIKKLEIGLVGAIGAAGMDISTANSEFIQRVPVSLPIEIQLTDPIPSSIARPGYDYEQFLIGDYLIAVSTNKKMLQPVLSVIQIKQDFSYDTTRTVKSKFDEKLAAGIVKNQALYTSLMPASHSITRNP